jgi:16S rRNA (guanine1207-N2)-methyltransferase
MTDHYFSEQPKSAFALFRIRIVALGQDIELYNASGLFSAKELDKGTDLLIRKALIKEKGTLLDLGCGNGAVGILMARAYGSKVIMSDINERAVFVAKKNVKERRLDIEVRKSDGFDKVPEKFDNILLNPPQTAGKKICEKLISDSKDHLNPGGTLQIVARHNKGGRMLSLHMKEVFGNVRDVAKKGGYRVYLSEIEDI